MEIYEKDRLPESIYPTYSGTMGLDNHNKHRCSERGTMGGAQQSLVCNSYEIPLGRVCIWLIHFVVQQKLTQNCEAVILQ